ncbi:hypothetical protein CEP51_014510 [Fusarium floridanum]|uniref:Uncharacterized protein n=1 Tax=Fusarium floridanum TaxID=1325733 RepID=A0A428PRP8_9HYPO|nr:hypothetical protein CEP51_014510 [Fusarium floridanum]
MNIHDGKNYIAVRTDTTTAYHNDEQVTQPVETFIRQKDSITRQLLEDEILIKVSGLSPACQRHSEEDGGLVMPLLDFASDATTNIDTAVSFLNYLIALVRLTQILKTLVLPDQSTGSVS